MRSNYLICYDISHPKRLRKIYNFLRRKFVHIQFSVFFGRMNYAELLDLKSELDKRINKKEDDIRIYPLTSDVKVDILGIGNRCGQGVEVFFEN